MPSSMDTSNTFPSGNSSHATFQDGLPSQCRPIAFQTFLPYALVMCQCALLHPTFAHSNLARLIRISLSPINVIWSLTLPFRYCFIPLESSAGINLGLGLSAIYTAVKCLEWGFATGAYYKRPIATINRVQRWEKVKEDEIFRKKQEDEPCGIFKLMTWTLLQLTSVRGLNFTWGPAAVANNLSTAYLMKRFIRISVPLNIAIVFVLLTRDSPLKTPTSALLSIGVPSFPGLKILAESIYSFSFGVMIACLFDTRFTFCALICTALHKIMSFLQFPEEILDLVNPLYLPPIFHSPQTSSSVAEFWAETWHTFLKRTFVVAGGKPLVWMAQRLGATTKFQRLAGLLGIFLASAATHEYILLVMAQPPHSNPHTITSLPGSTIFFMLQPLGILIEPSIIPHIPKRIGGGKLWTILFLIATCYSFREQYLGEGRVVATLRPLPKWSLLYALSPLKEYVGFNTLYQ
ncbi:uncharacterized protein MELLADRAFT_105729 [Melampsora larici-populina 98AG31]|uniref:Wax synthase domain-containing protein n=1 Tax=Melampsora larici-populina (strain 98AG31 / pathotype 3-4-7) TaxID=747676 RepID=F4RJ66_MELLP|nr:uncharacterized protein MELLADRAFT_105729 [Melampsora larici-populina 98AG31]EGG07705.1 hypothetical protein MELLADRAFT_105729 [Melampsora larici-populina 98AG31]